MTGIAILVVSPQTLTADIMFVGKRILIVSVANPLLLTLLSELRKKDADSITLDMQSHIDTLQSQRYNTNRVYFVQRLQNDAESSFQNS